MSLSPSAQRAIEWIETQVTELTGIRNATARDPIFKNWRQATLTALQRIWPGDQPRLERFLRIPFSPVDPRADLRVMREWYSRGCQEAVRVLNGYIAEIRANGVPEQRQEEASESTSDEFAVDFPTVDLPSGDLGSAPPLEIDASNTLADFVDSAPQDKGSNFPAPPALHRVEGSGRTGAKTPQAPKEPDGGGPGLRRGPPALPRSENVSPTPASAPTSSGSPSRMVEKGQGMMAKLKELLGLMQGPAKAPPPRESPSREMKAPGGSPSREMQRPTESPSRELKIPRVPVESPSREMRRPESLRQRSARDVHEGDLPPSEFPSLDLPPSSPQPPARDLDIVALGDPVTRGAQGSGSAPGSGAVSPPSGAAANDPRHDDDAKRSAGGWPLPRNVAPEDPNERAQETSSPADQPPSPPAAGAPGSAAAANAPGPGGDDPGTARREPGMSVVMSRPTTLRGTISKVSIESLLSDQFRGTSSQAPASGAAPTPERPAATPPAAETPAAQTGTGQHGASSEPPFQSSAPSEPEEEIPGAPIEELLSGSSGLMPRPPGAEASIPREPEARSNVVPLPVDPRPERDVVDPEAIARATENFMRSSPVLGATGRKVKRERDASEYEDPDAIAVASMVEDLGRMGVPTGRHSETRARLLDVARRIEKGELEWPVLKKAVWFAMDYPELARRLVPILLPWFDRAA